MATRHLAVVSTCTHAHALMHSQRKEERPQEYHILSSNCLEGRDWPAACWLEFRREAAVHSVHQPVRDSCFRPSEVRLQPTPLHDRQTMLPWSLLTGLELNSGSRRDFHRCLNFWAVGGGGGVAEEESSAASGSPHSSSSMWKSHFILLRGHQPAREEGGGGPVWGSRGQRRSPQLRLISVSSQNSSLVWWSSDNVLSVWCDRWSVTWWV